MVNRHFSFNAPFGRSYVYHKNREIKGIRIEVQRYKNKVREKEIERLKRMQKEKLKGYWEKNREREVEITRSDV